MESSLAAYVALFLWPVVALLLYLFCSAFQATFVTFLGAHLLLPVGTSIKIDMLPQIDKTTIPSFCALIGCLVVLGHAKRPVRGATALGRVAGILMFAYVVGAVLSALLNGDTLIIGDRVLPGTGLYDGLSGAEAAVITMIPFYLGWKYFGSENDAEQLIASLVVAGVLYSFLMLFEIRFSPQLHFWIYGYYPTDFQQQIRGGGYRPMVFTGHGLLAGIFLMTAVAASAAMARVRAPLFRVNSSMINGYLGAVLILCKSAGALVFGSVAAGLIWLASPRAQVKIAVVLVSIALGYPLLRSLDVFPTGVMTDVASSIEDERGRSIATRFRNEDALLSRLAGREFFGWGRYGRSRVYDPVSGRDITIADGRWIQTLGQFGLVGFLAEFGLLSLGVYRAVRAMRSCRRHREMVYLAALALIASLNVLDLLPNSTLRPWTWFLCGLVFARGEYCVARERERKPLYGGAGAIPRHKVRQI